MYNKSSKAPEQSSSDEEKRKLQKNNGDIRTVANPKWLLVTGVIGVVVLLSFALLCLFKISDNTSVAFSAVFVLFSFWPASMIISFINCRVYYDDDGFTYKSFFGKKQRYLYSEIDCIHYRRKGDYGIKVNGKEILIDALAIGSSTFMLFAKEKCRQLNGGRDVPDFSPKAKLDLFKGNIKNPESYLMIYSLLLVLSVFVFVLTVIPTEPTQKSELIFVEESVLDYEVQDDTLVFEVDGVKLGLYLYGYNQTVTDIEKLYYLFESKEQLRIGYNPPSFRSLRGNRVEYIEDSEGVVYTTPEDYIRYYKENIEPNSDLISTLVALAILFYIVFSVYVGRHPQKFNKKFVNLFYKGNLVDKEEI